MKLNLSPVFSIIIACAGSTPLLADPWQLDLNANVTSAVNSYSNSWVGGDAGSFNWASQFLGVAERQIASPFNTKTTLNLQFGQTKAQDKTTKRWSAPQKSSDLIDLEELFRLTLGGWVDPFASVRAISEFVDGSDTLLERNINPINVTEAIGASRTLQKVDNLDWSTRLGVAARQQVDRNRLDATTGDRKTKVTNDGGFEFNMDLKTATVQKWVTFSSALRVYEALVSTEADLTKGTTAENYWRYPHAKWENSLILTVARYLMFNLTAEADYDRELSNEARLKECVSAGLTYQFTTKKPAQKSPDKEKP